MRDNLREGVCFGEDAFFAPGFFPVTDLDDVVFFAEVFFEVVFFFDVVFFEEVAFFRAVFLATGAFRDPAFFLFTLFAPDLVFFFFDLEAAGFWLLTLFLAVVFFLVAMRLNA